MEKLLLLFILFLLPIKDYAQFKLLDSKSHQPIGYASIFNSKGALLSNTDTNGLFFVKNGIRNISISHVAYTNKDINLDTLKGNIVYMDAKEQRMAEVHVATKRPEYVVFECYFRCPQFYNSKLEYYRDGIALYFVKLKNRHINHSVITSRYLVDENIRKEEEVKGSKLSYRPPIPYLEFCALNKKMEHQQTSCLIDSLSSSVTLNFDGLLPDTVLSFNFGKYHQQLKKSYTSEVYKLNPDRLSYTDFVSGRWARQMIISCKNITKIFNQWEEVYVTKVSYANRQDLKNLINNRDENTDIDSYLNHHSIPPISNKIKKGLAKMKTYKP